MNILAVAWDIDGTLTDSEPVHHRALLSACKAWGVDLSDFSMEDFRGMHIRDVWSIVRKRMPRLLSRDSFVSAVEERYLQDRRALLPVPGSREAVEAIASRGIPQVCVSNSGRTVVNATLSALGLSERIRFSISLNDVDRGKPDPQPYQRAAQRLGIEPRAIIAVEDSTPGVLSARAAGMLVVGYAPNGERLSDAHVSIHNLESVVHLLNAPEECSSK